MVFTEQCLYISGVLLPPDADPSLEFAIAHAQRRYDRSNSAIVNNRLFHLQVLKARPPASSPSWDYHALWQAVCDQLKHGFLVLIASLDHDSAPAIVSLADRLHIPLINIGLPPRLLPLPYVEKHNAQDDAQLIRSDFLVNLRPRVDVLLAEWIHWKRWPHVLYVHDTPQDALLMQRVLANVQRLEQNTARARQLARLHGHNDSAPPQPYTHVHCSLELIQLPSVVDSFAEFLYELHKVRFSSSHSEQRVLISASTSSRRRAIVRALEHVPLQSPEMFHYVFIDFGVTQEELDRLKTRFFNVTVLNVVDFKSERYEAFETDYQTYIQAKQQPPPPKRKRDASLDDLPVVKFQKNLPAEAVLLYDAIELALAAVQVAEASGDIDVQKLYHRGQFYNYEFAGIYCVPSEDTNVVDRQPRPFIFGRNISEHIRNSSLSKKRTLTGMIEFGDTGHRHRSTIRIWDVSWQSYAAAWPLQFNLTWNTERGFQFDDEYFRHSNADNQNEKKLYITTIATQPFTIPSFDEAGNLQLTGYCIDLIDMLAKKLNFEYEVHLVADRKYGGVTPNKTWNGMIGELISGKADMAVAPLTITKVRERVVDFSKPFITTGVTIMIKKPDRQEFAVFSFLQPLSTEIWLWVCAATCAVSLVIFVCGRCSPLEAKARASRVGGGTNTLSIGDDLSLYNCVWFTFAAFVQQGTDIAPQCVAVRIASGSWWFFTLIILASYTANLAAFLTSERLLVGIDSVDALAGQTHVKYGIQANGSTQEFFQYSAFPTYQRMWRYMSSQHPSVLVSSYSEGIQRVRHSKGGYAFLLENTANQYANTRKPCDTMKVGDFLNQAGYGVATPFRSPYRHRLNLAILDLHETGELKRLENKWWFDRGQCDISTGRKDSGASSLEMSKVAGCFYILMAGLAIAMITAWIEHNYRTRQQAKRLLVMRVFGEAVRVAGVGGLGGTANS